MGLMRADGRERAISAGTVVLLHAAALWLLLDARDATQVPPSTTSLATFEISATPPRIPEHAQRAARPAGQSGRSGVKAERAAIAAPVPIIVLPQPVPAPTEPQSGTAIVGGAAATGTGSGVGQSGTGAGSGGAGDGSGAGAGTRARWLSGTIGPRDYPKAARSAQVGGTVTVAFTVATDGRPRGCTVVASSGSTALDATTCALVEARFHYAPARDAAGAPISERRGWRQRWWLEGD